jgi:hypothetical protein
VRNSHHQEIRFGRHKMTKTAIASGRTINLRAITKNIKLITSVPAHASPPKTQKFALLGISFSLLVALACVAMVIGTSAAQASSLPAFSVANAIAAKQSASVSGFAIGSLIVIVAGGIFALPRKAGKNSNLRNSDHIG